ncbi:hypothetical protein BJ165DRAFT_493566 [Panaeolus papilionaceus]|nr:hypothetical protein BJ165DRAFT_493566 [Panaeolus papilionaceus]
MYAHPQQPTAHYHQQIQVQTAFDYFSSHDNISQPYSFDPTTYPAAPDDTTPVTVPQSFILDPQMTSYLPQPFIPSEESSRQSRTPVLATVPVTTRILPGASSSPAPRLSRPRIQPSIPGKQSQFHNPYARLAKKDEVKRRRIWNHAFEKAIFSPYELSTINAPNRRKIYISSLEHHIDHMHQILADMGHYPVGEAELDRHVGLNRKTAKSMVSGLFHDSTVYKLQLLELARANGDLQKILASFPPEHC